MSTVWEREREREYTPKVFSWFGSNLHCNQCTVLLISSYSWRHKLSLAAESLWDLIAISPNVKHGVDAEVDPLKDKLFTWLSISKSYFCFTFPNVCPYINVCSSAASSWLEWNFVINSISINSYLARVTHKCKLYKYCVFTICITIISV